MAFVIGWVSLSDSIRSSILNRSRLRLLFGLFFAFTFLLSNLLMAFWQPLFRSDPIWWMKGIKQMKSRALDLEYTHSAEIWETCYNPDFTWKQVQWFQKCKNYSFNNFWDSGILFWLFCATAIFHWLIVSKSKFNASCKTVNVAITETLTFDKCNFA